MGNRCRYKTVLKCIGELKENWQRFTVFLRKTKSAPSHLPPTHFSMSSLVVTAHPSLAVVADSAIAAVAEVVAELVAASTELVEVAVGSVTDLLRWHLSRSQLLLLLLPLL